MVTKSPSNFSLVRSDSGIDIASDCGIHMDKTHSTDTPSTPTSSRSDPDEGASRWSSWKHKLFPPRGSPAKWFTWTLVLALVFGVIWALAPNEMQPGKSWFGLTITILLCFASEILIVKIPTPRGFPPPPPLLASLLMGLALKNLPAPVNVAAYISDDKSRTLRELALTVILTRAGLEIDPEAMAKVKWAVVRLAFLPCLAETVTFGVIAHFLLNFPFEWSFMTGFMLAAVSPAVVIPSLIILQSAGLGVAEGVPSLVMAASGIDDVLAIAGFSVLLGIALPGGLEEEVIGGHQMALDPTTTAFTSVTVNGTTTAPVPHNVGKEIAGAVIEIVIGITAGLLLGFFISYIPSQKMHYKSFCRAFLLLSIGIFFVFGTEIWGIPGSGTLCALIMSFVAAFHWGDGTEPLERIWHYMWLIFQPILFGLTGALVDVNIMDPTTCGLGIALLACSMTARLITSTSVTFGLNLKMKERIFVSISWIPKGTVQAALGSAALDQARRLGFPPGSVEYHRGEQILVLAVLATLITAPIGAFGISYFGPKLLRAPPGSAINPHDNEAFQASDESMTVVDDHDGNKHSHRHSHLPGLQVVVDHTLDEIQEEDTSDDGFTDEVDAM